MTKNTRFSPEVRQRAVRMVLESQGEYDSQWAAICSIAPKIGCTPETLRVWVRWEGWTILLRQKQKKLIMLPSETMIWQPEFTDKTLSRKPGTVHINMLGHYSFTLAELVTKGHLRPLKEASEEENIA
ncbi:putative transposase family protein [Escherichia coli]|nr:putative transposase family protein [Escherichia coli]